jgi:hypothetical protein
MWLFFWFEKSVRGGFDVRIVDGQKDGFQVDRLTTTSSPERP